MNCGDAANSYAYDGLADLPLGSAYVPWQRFEQVFEPEKGLMYGSIFAELVYPFYGARAACGNMGNGRRNNCGQGR